MVRRLFFISFNLEKKTLCVAVSNHQDQVYSQHNLHPGRNTWVLSQYSACTWPISHYYSYTHFAWLVVVPGTAAVRRHRPLLRYQTVMTAKLSAPSCWLFPPPPPVHYQFNGWQPCHSDFIIHLLHINVCLTSLKGLPTSIWVEFTETDFLKNVSM